MPKQKKQQTNLNEFQRRLLRFANNRPGFTCADAASRLGTHRLAVGRSCRVLAAGGYLRQAKDGAWSATAKGKKV